METIDFTKSLKAFYTAKQTMQEVLVPSGTFLAVEKCGEPGGETFEQAIQSLFTVVFTAKFGLKGQLPCDFKVSKLECVYLSDPAATARTQWRWRLMVRIPDQITAANVTAVKKMVKEKREVDASAVKRLRWNEGRAVQVLHVGPYDRIGQTCRWLRNEAEKQGFSVTGPVHEIYISDPRRTTAEKLKTIVRLGVKR